MCGIAGIVDPGRSAEEIRLLVQQMAAELVHRGPDDEGFFVADGIGLGIRRLSIIDVAGGHQPIASEDGRVQVVLNGEIYNYLQLRRELERRGHSFSTRSDTEVIVHGYEDGAERCVEDLRGMFGLALWDDRRRRLLLARDRLGKKPLFYAHDGERLLFASEIKALLAADPALAEQDLGALVPYLRYGFICEPRTMFRRIRKLPAAHSLLYENGKLEIAPYWQLPFAPDDGAQPDVNDVREELDSLLAEAVRIRLMSEVPLGIFLSGGLDSSTIVAYAQRASAQPLKTFTIGFDRPEWDESADAEVVARHFGTEHHVLQLREQDLAANLPDTVLTLVRHFDEPFGDASALPTFYVSKLAREHATVILGGDGGDELFAGYSSYRGIKFAEGYRRIPAWLGRDVLPKLVESSAGVLPAGRRYGALRAAKILRDSALPFEQMYFSKGVLSSQALLTELLTTDARRGLPDLDGNAYPADIRFVMAADLPWLSKVSYTDLRFGLLEDMLVKVDRMSMAHSLEVRSPFLDHKLVEFAARLPASFKLRGWQTKAILRDVVRSQLPAGTLRKRKQGFSVPLREWLRADLYEMASDYLTGRGGRLPETIFDRSAVEALLRQHRHGEADHSNVVWLLLNYAAWKEIYVARPGEAVLAR